jgi:tRNA nucleotidyltransferase/poly(A) polymerase
VSRKNKSTLRKGGGQATHPATAALGVSLEVDHGWGDFHQIAQLLQQLGVQAYLVGGAVRDILQGRELRELDFAVSEGAIALARTVGDRLGGAFVLLDKERDTGRVILRGVQGDPVSIDFTRFRGEGIIEDLSLRDFTINAMALDVGDVGEKEPGRVVDPLDGQADLAAGIIRATSSRAIGDDPVRALRAVRLAGELGFALAPATAELVRESASLLKNVSAERLRDELCKILAQPNAAGQLRALDGLELLEPTLPEVAELRGMGRSQDCRLDLLERAIERVAALEALLAAIALTPGTGAGYGQPEMEAASANCGGAGRILLPFSEFLGAHLSSPTAGYRSRLVLLKLATLLCAVGKPGSTGDEQISAAVAERIAWRLRLSKKETRLVRAIVAHHRHPYHLLGGTTATGTLTRRVVYRFFRDTEGAGLDVLLLSLADHLPRMWDAALWSRHLEVVAFLLKTYRDQHQAVISPPPLINGHEVMRVFGLGAGPRLGRILDSLREEQAAGEVVDRAGALAYVARLCQRGQVSSDGLRSGQLCTDNRGKPNDV